MNRKYLEDLEGLQGLSAPEPVDENMFEYKQGTFKPKPEVMLLAVAKDKFLVGLDSIDQPNRVLAVAGGSGGMVGLTDESKGELTGELHGALVIKHVSISPTELDRMASEAAGAIKEGLRGMADDLGFYLMLPNSFPDDLGDMEFKRLPSKD